MHIPLEELNQTAGSSVYLHEGGGNMTTGGQRAEQDRLVVRILSARELSVLLRKGENMEIIGRYSGPCSNAPVDQQDSACWLANRPVG